MITEQDLHRASLRMHVAKGYLTTYAQVMKQLEDLDNVQMLVGPVNTLLKRMLALQVDVLKAAKGLMDELHHDGARAIVRTAVVDIVLNERKPGEHITEVPSMATTFARDLEKVGEQRQRQ